MKLLVCLVLSTLGVGVTTAATTHPAVPRRHRHAVSQPGVWPERIRRPEFQGSRSAYRRALRYKPPLQSTVACTASTWRSHVNEPEAYIISHEHGVNSLGEVGTYQGTHAWNPQSTSTGHAFGLGQLTDVIREHYAPEVHASVNTTDPCAQLVMLRLYARDRYGTEYAAMSFWEQHGWW